MRKATACFDFHGCVVPDLQSVDKFDAITELVKRTAVFRDVKNNPAFLNAVFNRERERSTGFGHGVAVAHAKTECVKRIEIALGISHRGIDFDSIDRLPVYLLFLIATPPYKSEIYLKLLSVLMTVMRNSDLREKLLALTDVNQIESLLDERFRCCYRAKTLDDI